MLHHNNNTQMNEAMNTSVAKYAPKVKSYSSLQTRVAIAAGIHNVGKHKFWKRAFHIFNIPLDSNLSDILHGQDVRAGKNG